MIIDIFLPLSLVFIMFTLGLGLTSSDFLSIFRHPRALFVGMVNQMVMLPLFALIISAAILLFASVMSAAPKIKITKSEVLIASAGVLTLIVIIASVAASQH